MKTTFKKIFGLATCFVISAVASPTSGTFAIVGGGGTSTDGQFTMTATIGQAAAGQMTAGSYTLSGGFWSADTAVPAQPRELIVNGSFENIAGTFVRDSFGAMSVPGGSRVIPGWVTTEAESAWVHNVNTFGAETPFGSHALDLTGYHDRPPYARVGQEIATTAGQAYRLSLSLGSNADYPNAGGQKSVFVDAGGATTTFVFDPTNSRGNQWNTFSFDFVAASTSTLIRINGLNAGQGVYLGLDNLSVVPQGLERRVTSILQVRDTLQFTFPFEAGRNYALESLADLNSPAWQILSEATILQTPDTVHIAVPISANDRQRFYRVQIRQD